MVKQNLVCPPLQIVVPGNTRTVHLERLIPDTPYSVNIVALYSDAEGTPSPAQGRTCEAEILSPPGSLVTWGGRPRGWWWRVRSVGNHLYLVQVRGALGCPQSRSAWSLGPTTALPAE